LTAVFASGSGSAGQRLDCRPQLVDQRRAIPDLFPLLDTGQCIPQPQQSFAAEPGDLQFLLRSDGDLALSHCGQWLSAQRNSVIANHVDAHGGFSWLIPRPVAAGDPLTLSLPTKATPFWINLVTLLGAVRVRKLLG
jgi:hypothetical protein